MKHFTRLTALFVITVFMFSTGMAQNTVMTKAQTLGLKAGTPVNVVANHNQVDALRTTFLEEGFDIEGEFPPADWTQDIFNPDNTWIQTNPEENDFNTIDPNSLFSAMVPWVTADQDEWLYSPAIDAMGEVPLTLEFYAGVSGPWIANATLKCHISDDGGSTWTELWNAADVIDPAADWAWNFVSIDISDYADAEFMLAWQYVGNDGDLAGIDGVSVNAGYEYLFQDDMESYTVGTHLAESDETGYWTTWSDSPGSAEDGLISDEESASPTQSCFISGTNDQLLLLGNKTSGAYAINVDYFIPSGYGGYINLQHFEAPGNEWACEVYFGAATGTENGYMYAGSETQIPVSFNHDEWFTMTFIVDLDEDLASFYMDDIEIAEWQFSLQAQGDPGTLQLGGVNLFAGAAGDDDPMYYFDNVEYIVLDPGISNPIIDVDPTSMFSIQEQGTVTEETVTVSNLGQQDLNFEIITNYPASKKVSLGEPAGTHGTKLNLNELTSKPVVGAEPYRTNRDELLHYDTENTNSIGSSAAYEWRVAAMFPAEMVAPYIGMEINEIHVFINEPGIEYKAQIYGMGSYNTPGPGDLLMEQDFTATSESWNYIDLDSPVMIEGGDIWVGYWVSADANMHTPGVDDGPANPNGDWMSSGPGWDHLSGNPDLNYNWNIRANLTGTPITQWLSADPTSGLLVQDESTDINVTIDANGLVEDNYVGKLLIRNNDPTNEEIAVNVTLGVTVGINEQGENEYVAVYPNPATTLLNIKSNGTVTNVTLVNTIGQVVYNGVTNAIDISNYDTGVYFVTIETENGTTTQKVMIQ